MRQNKGNHYRSIYARRKHSALWVCVRALTFLVAVLSVISTVIYYLLNHYL